MDSIYSSMLSSLCLDLGYVLKPNYTLEELGVLKNALTKLTETDMTSSECAPFVARLSGVLEDPSGSLKDLCVPCVFRDVYQVLSFLLKKPAEVTQTQENEYIAKFKATEQETRQWRIDPKREDTRLARSIVRYITSRGPSFDAETLINRGRHGPGAVLGGERGSDKNYFSSLPRCARGLLGDRTLYANDFMAELEHDRCDARYVESKLILVPKSYKGPRGVFVSPKEIVFCQLALDDALKESVIESGFGNCWDPRSQVPSQELAYSGSYSGWSATLDLSDASDRVPLSLVNALFRRPDYLALARSRPSFVTLPNGERHRLAMFAPMGDGKTFSVLSVVCLSLTLAAIYVARGGLAARFNVKELRRCMRGVRVFGDDIVVPTEFYASVVSTLQAHNLKVNMDKSFHKGKFREACGCDAFNGTVVTPLRVTSRMSELQDTTLTNWVAFANRCRLYYPRLVRLHTLVVNYITQRYPDVGWTSRPDRNPYCLFRQWGRVACVVREPYPDSREGAGGCVKTLLPNGSVPANALVFYHSVPNTKGLRVRFNTELQRLEQRCVVRRKEIVYPSSYDPRWDLSYWLLPKARIVDSEYDYASDRIPVRGSPKEQQARDREWQRMLQFIKASRKWDAKTIYRLTDWSTYSESALQRSWVPLE